MRHAMGIAVFAGMIGVTSFGLFLTPIFYVLLRTLVTGASHDSTEESDGEVETPMEIPSPAKVAPSEPEVLSTLS
jgi:multidrug efflux pump